MTAGAVDACARDGGVSAGNRSTAEELLGRWLELSELERRAFIAMTRELAASSTVIETSAIDLSQRFQLLAETATRQMGRVEAVIATGRCIKIDGEEIALTDATRFIEGILIKVIDTVLAVSKNAMRMVYSLDEVAADVAGARKCVSQLHSINHQTRFLALNAAIEAARAGANGGPFSVIAHEIRELSKQTDAMAKSVSSRIVSIDGSVSRSHAVLQEIATIDLSEHIIAKHRLDALLGGMIEQNNAFTSILTEAADASAELSTTIAPLVMGLQFQDRTTQQLTHVIEALDTLAQATESLQQATHDAMPDAYSAGEIDQAVLDRIVDRQTLGAVRKRFLAQLISDTPPIEEEAPDSGDIDLF
jgi:methyl-accepting chemotaxis protein